VKAKKKAVPAIPAKLKMAKKKPAVVDGGVKVVRLARVDGPDLTFRISKQAVKRWLAVPTKEKERSRESAKRALYTASKDDPSFVRLGKLMKELEPDSKRRKPVIRTSSNAACSLSVGRADREMDYPVACGKHLLSLKEAELVALWRRGRRGDRAAVRRMCDKQDRIPALYNEVDEVLRYHWYVAEGFGLCWLSASALTKVLDAWGLLKRKRRTDWKEGVSSDDARTVKNPAIEARRKLKAEADADKNRLKDKLADLGLKRIDPVVVDVRDVAIKGRTVKIV